MVRYMVQSGDTLGNIAVKYGTSVDAIVRANGIRNPNMIYKGQILRIPTHHYDDDHHGHHYYSSHDSHHNYDDHDHHGYHDDNHHDY